MTSTDVLRNMIIDRKWEGTELDSYIRSILPYEIDNLFPNERDELGRKLNALDGTYETRSGITWVEWLSNNGYLNVPSDEDDHILAKYIAAGDSDKTMKANPGISLKFHQEILLARGPATEQAHRILQEVLPDVLDLFIAKNADYGDIDSQELGPKAEFVRIHNKHAKLKRGLWEGQTLEGEQVQEIVMDQIGHLLLILDGLRREK